MKKTIIISIHLGYWLMYLLLLVVIFASVGVQPGKPPSLSHVLPLYPLISVCLVPNLLSFYASYLFLFRRFLYTRKILLLGVFVTVTCFSAAMTGCFISAIFYGFNQTVFTNGREFISLFVILFSIAAIHAVIALVIKGFIDWFEEIKLKEELLKKNYEMESALIKSQLNPHFLFNTINNIDFLITKDASKASDYLNKLSGILRYLLYNSKTEKIILVEELQYLEKYIELQKIRTANRNYVNYEVRGDVGNQLIAPMIFFPFIENAFKHTENNKSFNTINIKIVIKNERIEFDCKNTYQPNQVVKQEYGGLGNELITKRLMLLYPGKHILEFSDVDNVYGVKLVIEL